MSPTNGGSLPCALMEECAEHHREVSEYMKELTTSMALLVDHVAYFKKLNNLDHLVEATNQQSRILDDIKIGLLSAATGKDQVSSKLVDSLLDRQTKSANLTYKILGGVILVLILAVAHLLTGEKLGWFNLFGN